MSESSKPSVLFVCVKNGGKSQMAAGLMRQVAGDTVTVYSAGTKPGTAVNELSAQALLEVGVDITAEQPKPVDYELARDVDLVVTLGREATLDPLPGTRVENWDTDEPSERGIDGLDRMRLVRDDIATRVQQLQPIADDLGLSMAQLAVAWVLQNDNVSAAIIGASRPEQVHENVKAAGVKLDADVLTRIDDVLGDVVTRDGAKVAESTPEQRGV